MSIGRHLFVDEGEGVGGVKSTARGESPVLLFDESLSMSAYFNLGLSACSEIGGS